VVGKDGDDPLKGMSEEVVFDLWGAL